MFPVTTFLVSVGTIAGITAVLAILMVIADATIANYGQVTIKINNDKDLTVQGGKSLLSTLMEESIFIPSACGGRGSCGLCKLQIDKGVGAYLPTEFNFSNPKGASGSTGSTKSGIQTDELPYCIYPKTARLYRVSVKMALEKPGIQLDILLGHNAAAVPIVRYGDYTVDHEHGWCRQIGKPTLGGIFQQGSPGQRKNFFFVQTCLF